MSFYENGPIRIHYEEAGSGFPLLLIAGGGLNSTISGLTRGPFNPIEEFSGEYRCIASDLRNANGGQSSGPLEVDRPWDAYTDDHLGLMDHLGIERFTERWGPALVQRRPDITMELVDEFLTKMYRTNADFVFTVTRDFVRNCQTPALILPDDIPWLRWFRR